MNKRGNGSGGPEDVDAAFAEIVAGLESEGLGRNTPTDPTEPEPTGSDSTGSERTGSDSTGGRVGRREDDEPDSAGTDSPGRDFGEGSATGSPASNRGWRTSHADYDPTWRTLDELDDPDDPEEHYQPPEPPPLPKPRKATIVVLLLIALGLLLLIAPGLLGMTSATATPISLLAITFGFGFFVLSKRYGPPPGGDSDGAQV